MADQLKITYDWVTHADIPRALEIEQQGYPIDEAATLEAFQFRQSQAGDLFLGAYIDGHELVGYICSTLSPSTTLTHESMSTHVPSSSSVCIHSVCVSSKYRRNHIAVNLLKEYISRLETACREGRPYERILLITHEPLRQLYEKAGFEWVGKSEVVHGSQPWYEMRKALTSDTTTTLPTSQVHSEAQQVPASIWDALQHSSKAKPTARPFSSFSGEINDLTVLNSNGPVNKSDIVCPRTGCGSTILKGGVGKWVERASVQIDLADHPPHPILPALPTPPEKTQWWLIGPSPMEFENIGFSRPVQAQSPSRPKMKLLACAECDLGPLGWSEEGGTEFWLACTRVAYRE